MWPLWSAPELNPEPLMFQGVETSDGRADGSMLARCSATSRAAMFEAETGIPSTATMLTVPGPDTDPTVS